MRCLSAKRLQIGIPTLLEQKVRVYMAQLLDHMGSEWVQHLNSFLILEGK